MSDGSREDLGSAASLLEALADAPGLDTRGPLVPGVLVSDKYRIERAIGHGGMGVVYLARDERLGRSVALKLGMHVGERALARMEREGQALAKLSHPNVVTIYEVGEHAERLFVAMEYVAGGTARAWCDGKTPKEILALYAAAGDGLAAAHAAGIIHRDFKPDNVLVGEDGRPRVADFGLALGRLDDEEPRGAVGTPAYMAPEQVAGTVVDERADQYAFACALWEALAGTRPSASATTSASAGAAATAVAAEAPPARVMPGHVAAALQRALALEPAERWPSMPDLLVELRRDPTAKRRKIAIGALAVIAVGSAVAIPLVARSGEDPCGGGEQRLAAVWNAERATTLERALGPRTAATVRGRLDDFGKRWVAGERDACRATRVDKTQTEAQLVQRTLCLHRARAHLGAIVQTLSGGGVEAIEHATDQLALLPDLHACADLAALSARPPPPSDPAARATLEQLIDELAAARAQAELQSPRPVAELDKTLGRARELGWAPTIAEAQYARAVSLDIHGAHADSHAAYRAAANAAITAAADDIAAYALVDLAWDLADTGRSEEATRELGLAEALHARGAGGDALATRILGAQRLIAETEGRGADALAASRQQVEVARRAFQDPVNDATIHLSLAVGYIAAGQPADGRREAQEALRQIEEVLGPDHPKVADFLRMLAGAEVRLMELDAAEKHYARALAIVEKWRGLDSEAAGAIMLAQISVLGRRGDLEGMRTLGLRALPILERADPHAERFGGLLMDLGVAAAQSGNLDEAGGYAARALKVFEDLGNPWNPALTDVLLLQGYVARGRGDLVESERHLRRAVELTAERATPSRAANAKLELSYTLVKAGRAREAVVLLAPVPETLDPNVVAELHQARADAMWSAGEKNNARREAELSRLAWTALGENFSAQRKQTEAWIASHR
jgi:eukaryotic-like serine/threonine-protein kinase